MPSRPTFNYYSELGVDCSASANEIKAAYRRLALQHHPDKNHGNSDEATAKFQRVCDHYKPAPQASSSWLTTPQRANLACR